jgi:hypothetical protein
MATATTTKILLLCIFEFVPLHTIYLLAFFSSSLVVEEVYALSFILFLSFHFCRLNRVFVLSFRFEVCCVKKKTKKKEIQEKRKRK